MAEACSVILGNEHALLPTRRRRYWSHDRVGLGLGTEQCVGKTFEKGRLPYQVLTATNGPEALAVWEQHQKSINLVITDMRMPKGLSGLELAEKLWEFKPSLKVIIMSGYSTEIAKENTEGNRNYTFLAKPFAIKALSETVRACLD